MKNSEKKKKRNGDKRQKRKRHAEKKWQSKKLEIGEIKKKKERQQTCLIKSDKDAQTHNLYKGKNWIIGILNNFNKYRHSNKTENDFLSTKKDKHIFSSRELLFIANNFSQEIEERERERERKQSCMDIIFVSSYMPLIGLFLRLL